MFTSVLLLIPQRYEFSSKSQQLDGNTNGVRRCCWYHKGTNFQANHNLRTASMQRGVVVADTTKVRIFKQITTNDDDYSLYLKLLLIPQRYEFSSKSQPLANCWYTYNVVADTTKVRIFKQITTGMSAIYANSSLLLIPQRYEFSSKSQQENNFKEKTYRCCWYHKGTNFQANHNVFHHRSYLLFVVADTTKVRIFKQITTQLRPKCKHILLLLIPQRYEFSSKSQLSEALFLEDKGCCWYHKGTNFQANHNTTYNLLRGFELLLIPQRYEFSSKSQLFVISSLLLMVVADTTKVRIFKQITTLAIEIGNYMMLLLIPQRYEFSSKSQHW